MQVRVSKHLADQEQIFFGTSLAYDQVCLFLPWKGAMSCLQAIFFRLVHDPNCVEATGLICRNILCSARTEASP